MSAIVSPEVQILKAAKATLAMVDFAAATRYTDLPAFTVRHSRNRPPPGEDKPSMCLFFNATDDEPAEQYKNAWEAVFNLDLSLIIDMDLPAEDSDEDETGWDMITAVAIVACRALIAENTPLWLVCDDVIIGSRNPDHDASGPDNGRLEQSVSVVYRVSTEDPGLLLARGENGG